jgi:HAMP domain-containing protein
MMHKERERSFFRTLRGKLSLQMLAVGLIPILAIGGLMYWTMDSAAENTSEKVDDTRSTVRDDMIGPNLISFTSGLLSMMGDQVTKVWAMSYTPVIVEAAENGATSVEASTEASAYLKDSLDFAVTWGSIMLTDDSGDVVAGAYIDPSTAKGEAGFTPGTNLQQTAVWQASWDTGLGFPAPFYNEDLNLIQIDIGRRVRDAQGNALGVLQATILAPPELVNQMFAGTEDARALMFDSGTGDLLIDVSDITRDATSELTDLERAVQEAILEGSSDSGSIAMGGSVAIYVKASSATSPMSSNEFQTAYAEAASWTAVVEQPEQTAFAALEPIEVLDDDLKDSSNTMVITLGVILMVFVVFALIAAYVLSRSITRPVAQLRDAAEKVSTGDLSATVPEGGDDEIGDLTESFERMIAAVRFLSLEGEDDRKTQS